MRRPRATDRPGHARPGRRVPSSPRAGCAAWARRQEIVDHADAFFVEHVLGALGRATSARSPTRWRPAPTSGASPDRPTACSSSTADLLADFDADADQLRAQAVRLVVARGEQGDEPEQLHRPDGRQLPGGQRPRSGVRSCRARRATADLTVPDPDYVLTLDADSVLLPEYCLRLLYLMEQSGHAEVAVAQTPYSAYPGSATRIERICRRHHRPAAHRAPGHDALRRDVLGGRQRRPAQAGARRHRRDRLRGQLGDPPLHPGPHGHRGHRVARSTSASTAGRSTTTPSGWPTAPRRRTSARCASSASAGPTAAC